MCKCSLMQNKGVWDTNNLFYSKTFFSNFVSMCFIYKYFKEAILAKIVIFISSKLWFRCLLICLWPLEGRACYQTRVLLRASYYLFLLYKGFTEIDY